MSNACLRCKVSLANDLEDDPKMFCNNCAQLIAEAITSSETIKGQIIEAGTDESGMPFVMIRTTEDELKALQRNPIYQACLITIDQGEKQDHEKDQ